MAESLILDAKYRGVGRIKRASGVFDPHSLTLMKATFKDLERTERGRELLIAIRERRLSCVKVYDAARRGELHELPSSTGMEDAETAWKEWLVNAAAEYSDDSLRGFRNSWNRIVRYGGRRKFQVAALPSILATIRPKMGGVPRAFNLTRLSVLSFLRDRGGRRDPLYLTATGVEPRRHRRAVALDRVEPLSPKELAAALATMPENKAAMCWTMATTGMLPKEYWGAWEAQDGAIAIHGTKAKGRDRVVPLVMQPAAPVCQVQRFRVALKKANGGAFPIKYFRRCYARWMELAGIPRTRRRLYMGHSSRDITDDYESHEIRRFLFDDAEAFRKFLTASHTETHTVAGGAEIAQVVKAIEASAVTAAREKAG